MSKTNPTSEAIKFGALEKKMEGICSKNELVYRLYRDRYPFMLVIRPTQGVSEQLSLLAHQEDEVYISPDAVLVFSMVDGNLTYKISQTFTISDALFQKLKNLFKNMHGYWMQYFYRVVLTTGLLNPADIPRFDTEEDRPEPSMVDDPPDDSCEGEYANA